MRALVAIDFACNDTDDGSFAGRVAMASYRDADLEAPFGRDVAFTNLPGSRLRLHRRIFVVSTIRYWVGNWCWDRYWFSREDASRVLRTLRSNGWRCTGGPTRLYDWFNGERSA